MTTSSQENYFKNERNKDLFGFSVKETEILNNLKKYKESIKFIPEKQSYTKVFNHFYVDQTLIDFT